MICLEKKNRGKESTREQNKGRKKEPTVVIKGKNKKDNRQRQKDQCSPIHKLLNQINSHHYSGDFQHYCGFSTIQYHEILVHNAGCFITETVFYL